MPHPASCKISGEAFRHAPRPHFALLLGAPPASASKHVEAKYSAKANPAADLQAALAQARKEHKVVLLDVGSEGCSWCRLMDKFLNAHDDLLDLLEHNYVVVKVYVSDDNENKAFLAAYPKIDGYPHIFVVDADGKLLESKNTGELEEGQGYNLERFRVFLAKYGRKE